MPDRFGPAYDEDAVSVLTGIDMGDLPAAVRDLRLLALPTAEGLVVPAFQFEEGKVLHRLPLVLSLLRTGVDDPWIWAHWLTTPLRRRHHPGAKSTFIDTLRDVGAGPVLRAARETADRWRGNPDDSVDLTDESAARP